jgi:hypothetical protein
MECGVEAVPVAEGLGSSARQAHRHMHAKRTATALLPYQVILDLEADCEPTTTTAQFPRLPSRLWKTRILRPRPQIRTLTLASVCNTLNIF